MINTTLAQANKTEEVTVHTTKLSDLKNGQSATITELPAGHTAKFRLLEMGLREQSKITVKKKMPLHGPVVIVCGTTEIAIGRDVANRIHVSHG